MSYIYEPEIEEEDGGYSIPKILVAVLILVLMGAGAYIYLQQRKLTTSVSYLLDSKKQAEQDLNEMIEKYNLAIDDNGSLEGELRKERDALIKYRDSIKNIKEKDLSKEANFKQTIQKLKEKSAIQFITPPPVKEATPIVINETPSEKSENSTEIVEENKETTSVKANTEEPAKTEVASTEKVKTPEPNKTFTTFKRVEIPATYPGCSGNATQKRACFSKKVKSHLARKFDASIIDGFDLKPGRKRIWINFDVDKFGRVVNITARGPGDMPRSPKKKLENEAVKVIKKLPKMVAARQNGSSVEMNYSVPVSFVVQ
jgi:protein TonB